MKDRSCKGNPFGRRGFMLGGAAAGLGLALPNFLSLRAQASDAASGDTKGPRANNVIHIFLPGGMAQQESFDPKPYAPIEYRGDLGVVGTNTGETFSSALPRVAQIADRLTVIRSMTHTEAAHERGVHQMFTGYAPNPALVYPSMGSVVSHELGMRHNLPPYVCIPDRPNEFAGPGYLSSKYAPFGLGSDPARGNFKVRDLERPKDIDDARDEHRREMLGLVNQHYDETVDADAVSAMDSFYELAFGLLDSKDAREAFRIDLEPKEVRDRYGRNSAGQRLLMARRLVAAGVRLVTLTYGGWDSHQRITQQFRRQMPALDQALAALIQDLESTGLLDETIVMVTTEFGRTPKLNPDAGRDHWPRVFSVAVAGGGFQRGLIYGASNSTASEPDDLPVSPADLVATVYHQLGISAEKELIAPGNRPIEIVKDGHILKELLV